MNTPRITDSGISSSTGDAKGVITGGAESRREGKVELHCKHYVRGNHTLNRKIPRIARPLLPEG